MSTSRRLRPCRACRTSRLATTLALLGLGALACAPGAIAAARATTSAPPPQITSVSPLHAEVGQVLTIRGSGFRTGAGKDTVLFKRDGQRSVFAPATTAGATRITIEIPDKLLVFLDDAHGRPGVRRFRLRVLAQRLGVAFTASALSPLIGPPGADGAVAGCRPDVSSQAKDSDGDGISNGLEHEIGTDPCKADTDGDGVSDGFEYESALDLDNRALPYPGKRPYPNPLDGTDANIDYDGDGLTMADEFALWRYTTRGIFPLTYSDGTKDSGGPTLVTPATASLDVNGNGVLEDGEKDADADGLSNWDELHGRLTPAWWAATFPGEAPFFGAAGAQVMSGTSATDPDSNGNGVPDAQDDQDHDGYTNLQELDRRAATFGAANLWVNPFNPCLPDPLSQTCPEHPPLASPYAPFPLAPKATYPLTTTDLGPPEAWLTAP